jgi:HAD superfamily hydrolase (TIGR01484 family)
MAVRLPGIAQALPKIQAIPSQTQHPVPQLIAKPLVISLDIDGTLIPWQGQPHYDEVALQRYSHTLNKPALKENAFLLLNTGRGLSAVKALAPLLAKFSVDGLGLNDGQQLFLNASESGTATDTSTWLSALQPKDEDNTWKASIDGWSTNEAMQSASDEFPKAGFTLHAIEEPRPEAMEGITHLYTQPIDAAEKPGPAWLLKFYPDQAYMEVTRSDNKTETQSIAQFANQLGARLRQALLPKWPKASYYTNITPKSTYIHLGPAGNSKGSLVHHLIEHRFEAAPKAVVSAGDSFNDREILSAENFGDTPNFPVQVGKHPALSEYLETHRPEQLEQTEAGQLDTGLKAQFAKLQSLLPCLRPDKPSQATTEATDQKLDLTA